MKNPHVASKTELTLERKHKELRKIFSLVLMKFGTILMLCIMGFNVSAQNKPCVFLIEITEEYDDCVRLQWSWPFVPAGNYGYTLYQWNDIINEWQTTSTNYNREIRVLNICPNLNGGHMLQEWMDDPAVGLDKIKVTTRTMLQFNMLSNPETLLKGGGTEYQYDVIMFGSWDSNQHYDLTPAGATAVKNFLDAGRGVLFGHDTQIQPHPNFASLKEYTNLDIDPNDHRLEIERGSTHIRVINDGFLLKYPHRIPYNENLTVPFTHSAGQYANGIVWMNYPDVVGNPPGMYDSPEIWYNGGTNNFYLTTWNNAAMIQTGHSNGAATNDEKRVLANTLWYLAQFTKETSAEVCSALDLVAPEAPTVSQSNNCDNKINISSYDNGNTYKFYIHATNTADYTDTCRSNEVIVVKKAGLRGFFISEDNNPNGVPIIEYDALGDIITPLTISAKDSQIVTYTVIDTAKYIHIQAVDYAGNLSEVTTTMLTPCVTTSITLDLKLFLQGVTQPGPVMTNYIQAPIAPTIMPELKLPVINPYGLPDSCSKINNVSAIGEIVDWIVVEIWGDLIVDGMFTDYTLLEQRALLLKADGSVVDTTGQKPQFVLSEDSVRIMVKHRNHLSVISSELLTFSGKDIVTWDFSTGVDKALKPPLAIYDPMILQYGVACLWAGDLNMNDFMDHVDMSIFNMAWKSGIFGQYVAADVNMDGIINNTDLSFVIQNTKLGLYSPIYFFRKR